MQHYKRENRKCVSGWRDDGWVYVLYSVSVGGSQHDGDDVLQCVCGPVSSVSTHSATV